MLLFGLWSPSTLTVWSQKLKAVSHIDQKRKEGLKGRVFVVQEWSMDLNRTLSRRETKRKHTDGVTLTGISQSTEQTSKTSSSRWAETRQVSSECSCVWVRQCARVQACHYSVCTGVNPHHDRVRQSPAQTRMLSPHWLWRLTSVSCSWATAAGASPGARLQKHPNSESQKSRERWFKVLSGKERNVWEPISAT